MRKKDGFFVLVGLVAGIARAGTPADADIALEQVDCAPQVSCVIGPDGKRFTASGDHRGVYQVPNRFKLSAGPVEQSGNWQTEVQVQSHGEFLINGKVREVTGVVGAGAPFRFQLSRPSEPDTQRSYQLSCESKPAAAAACRDVKSAPAVPRDSVESWGLSAD